MFELFSGSQLKVLQNLQLISSIIAEEPETYLWSSREKFSLVNLERTSAEFIRTSHQFKSYYKRSSDYIVLKVERIENPELLAAFALKRNEMELEYPPTRKKVMFHATIRPVCEKIAHEGFDWRLAGQKRGDKWGHGTSFSPYSDFASQFTSVEAGGVRSMLMCYVLIGKSQVGIRGLQLPICGDDTTTSRNNRVYVKYQDHTSYPAYIVTYRDIPFYGSDLVSMIDKLSIDLNNL